MTDLPFYLAPPRRTRFHKSRGGEANFRFELAARLRKAAFLQARALGEISEAITKLETDLPHDLGR